VGLHVATKPGGGASEFYREGFIIHDAFLDASSGMIAQVFWQSKREGAVVVAG
jgi:hypothetical protein